MHLLDSYINTLAFLIRTALKALNRLGNAQADLGLFCLQTVNNTLLVSLAMMLLILVHVHYMY